MTSAFQKSYSESLKIENGNLYRDIDILNQISGNEYYFNKVNEKELQVEGADFIGLNRKDFRKKPLFIDIKTSNKKARECFVFELYYEYNRKFKSWSLHDRPDMTDTNFIIAFLDNEQAVTISKKKMIEVLNVIEEIKPELIRIENEKNRKGEPVKKYIVILHKDNIFFKNMKPKIYKKYGEEFRLINK